MDFPTSGPTASTCVDDAPRVPFFESALIRCLRHDCAMTIQPSGWWTLRAWTHHDRRPPRGPVHVERPPRSRVFAFRRFRSCCSCVCSSSFRWSCCGWWRSVFALSALRSHSIRADRFLISSAAPGQRLRCLPKVSESSKILQQSASPYLELQTQPTESCTESLRPKNTLASPHVVLS